MEAISRIWARGRTVVMGQVISETYFENILQYFESAIVNKLSEDDAIYTMDLFEPDEQQLKEDPSALEDFKKKKEYADLMDLAIAISSAMLLEGKMDFEKNKLEVDAYNRFLLRPDKITDTSVFLQVDCDALNDETIAKLESFCQMVKDRNYNLQLVVYRGVVEKIENGRVLYNYSAEELNKLDKVNNLSMKYFNKQLIHQAGASLTPRKRWYHDEVVVANHRLEKLAQDLLKLRLSPVEMMVVIHKYCSSFVYMSENYHLEDSRTILSVLSDQETPAIVCAAYANLEKALIDKLTSYGYEGLDCQLSTYRIRDHRRKDTFHCFCIVDVDDKKYNIKTKCYEDATKDAPTQKVPYQQAFNHLLLPISDVAKMKKIYRLYESNVQFMQETVSYIINKGSLKNMKGYKLACPSAAKELDKTKQPPKMMSLAPQSHAIDYDTMKKVIGNAYKKMLAHLDEKEITRAVNYEIAMSLYFAKYIFKKNATNAFAVKAHSLTKQEFEDIKNFVFPSEEVFEKLHKKASGKEKAAQATDENGADTTAASINI